MVTQSVGRVDRISVIHSRDARPQSTSRYYIAILTSYSSSGGPYLAFTRRRPLNNMHRNNLITCFVQHSTRYVRRSLNLLTQLSHPFYL